MFIEFMKEELKALFPSWVNESEYGKYDLCLSDDIDSLLSCMLLNQLFGYKIRYFYDFKSIYVSSDLKERREVIGVDLALTGERKVWDNHVTMLDSHSGLNSNAANLNSIKRIGRDDYSNKYAGSTALQIYSYYGVPLPTNREALLVLLAIDASYKGHYIDWFKMTNNNWFRDMGFDSLIEFMNTVTDTSEYRSVINKYRLNKKIYCLDNELLTNVSLEKLSDLFEIDIVLPDVEFEETHSLQRGFYNIAEQGLNDLPKNAFSLAFTSKNNLCFSK